MPIVDIGHSYGPILVGQDGGVIGSRWERREPAGDNYDRVICSGVFDLGPDLGLEIVYVPVEFGPTLTADVESFAAAYTRLSDDPSDDPAEGIDRAIRDIEART